MTIGAVLKAISGGVISVEPSATVLEISQIFRSRRISAVLVLTAEHEIAGIVTDRDIVNSIANHEDKAIGLGADQIMTANAVTVTPQTTVDEAMEIMEARSFNHLPVLDGGLLSGIVSIHDLVRYRRMLRESDVDNMRAYIARLA